MPKSLPVRADCSQPGGVGAGLVQEGAKYPRKGPSQLGVDQCQLSGAPGLDRRTDTNPLVRAVRLGEEAEHLPLERSGIAASDLQ